jgi:hypothetical protein
MIVFGYTFGGDVENVSVILVNEDEQATIPVPGSGPGNFTMVNLTFGDYIDEGLNRNTLSIRTSDDLNGSKEAVRSSRFFEKAWAVIYIPKDFSKVFSQYITRVALSKTTTNSTVCVAMGFFWYDGSCHPFQATEADKYATRSDCEGAGFNWFSNNAA